MKKTLILLLGLLIISCVSKKRIETKETTDFSKQIEKRQDSSFSAIIQRIESINQNYKNYSNSSDLNLIPIIDSSGKTMPISYIEKRDGKSYREVYLTGGTLQEKSNKTESYKEDNSAITTNKNEKINAKTASTENQNYRNTSESIEKMKKGMRTGIYIVSGFVIVIIIVLAWITWQMKKIRKSLNLE